MRSITSEFEVIMGRPERVADACTQLRRLLSQPPTASEVDRLSALLPLLRAKGGPIAAPLFDLLARTAAACGAPWPLLAGLLAARDHDLVRRALDLTVELAESKVLSVDRHVAEFLADQVETETSPLSEAPALPAIAGIVRRLPATAEDDDPLRDLYRRGSGGSLPRLAARLLDIDGRPVSDELALEILGPSAHAFLRPYLDYTRASHLDLLHLVRESRMPPLALPSLAHAEAIAGSGLMRDVIATLGWQRINLGIEVREYVGLSLGGSIPLLVSPAEALLIESATDARRVSELFLFVAHGGLPHGHGPEGAPNGAVAQFRAYNLAHAEALADILDVAPLTREKVRRIVHRMDRIVADFIALFASYSEECEILPSVYGDLKQRVSGELAKETTRTQLSPELTRLVQMFEDPASLGDVRTLHGLKRYLHQRGLKLGLRLVERGPATNRTVCLVTATRRKILRTFTRIDYVDFEPEGEQTDIKLPYPIAVAADGCGRQLLDGQEGFPSIKIFCYGNEVHYYLMFKNHPAFLRIDYSPPLKGGMIDLEYYGVSNYELSVHPDPALDAIRRFFRRLDCDVQIEGTRLHVRYDKERALDLGDLCAKAEALGRLIPFLMDLDWIIGGLDLDADARRQVAAAWADRFALSGVLPIGQLLTRNRQGILVAMEAGPAGEREVSWPGDGPYRDRFFLLTSELVARLSAVVEALGIHVIPTPPAGEHEGPKDRIPLEHNLLRPLREAVAGGELEVTPDGLRPCPPERFRRRHEAQVFAEILAADDEVIARGALLARLVAPLERSLRFRTTGSVNAYEVQRASLPLHGETLGLYALRDAGGIIRLALFSRGDSIFDRRDDPHGSWRSNLSLNPNELSVRLRRANYLPPGPESLPAWDPGESPRIRETFQLTSPIEISTPLPGERLVSGLRAAPGRAVGTVLFGTEGRSPADFDGVVLVAPAVRPEDSMFLHHAAAIVGTGGGILSHAGLIAIQLRKPALIISGQWREEHDGTLTLLLDTLEYREEMRDVGGYHVALRRDMRVREHRLREGDLVVVDAQAGTLRVLGHGRETLALHDELRQFAAASECLTRTTDEAETLLVRGRQLRARYQIGKLLHRLTDPVLARHAVHELLLGGGPEDAGGRSHQTPLLSVVLDNPHVGQVARQGLLQIGKELRRRHRAAVERAAHSIPTSTSTFEVLALRMTVLRLHRTLEGVAAALVQCGLDTLPFQANDQASTHALTTRRFSELRAERLRSLAEAGAGPRHRFQLRHLIREIGRLDLLLGTPEGERQGLIRLDRELARADDTVRRHLAHRRILGPADGGYELHPLIGWKAANLAEVEQLGASGQVPPWFAVTEHAFNEVLDAPPDRVGPPMDGGAPAASTLREAIDAIMARSDLGPGQKSAEIRQLWDQVALPRELIDDVVTAYRRLADPTAKDTDMQQWRPEPPVDFSAARTEPFVAVRSSGLEEDAESAARAGEFDTFLFIRGEDQLLTYLKRAWSGLWTERAMHNRAAFGPDSQRPRGGVIVQRMVESRVSGVLQTVNLVEGELREMVINAGLGLGEGIVSGTVAADQVVVAKGDDGREEGLRFRYLTSDKRSRVVFNQRAGFGTALADTLYHQRLRPALEYVELRELVEVATQLEVHYGYPLDIEFAIEGTRLWVLQARPLAVYLPVLRETLAENPLPGSAVARCRSPHEESSS